MSLATTKQALARWRDMSILNELLAKDGLSVVLEFFANVGEKKLKGIDMIRFNKQGQIVDFEVMIRPKSGLEALAVQMGQRMAAFAPQAG